MALILCILSWKECYSASSVPRITPTPSPAPLSPTLRCIVFFHSPFMHQSVSVLDFACAHVAGRLVHTQHAQVSFIANTYFTTFPAPQLKEDQTSFRRKFSPRAQPGERATQEITHTHTQWVGWKRRGKRERYISHEQMKTFFSTDIYHLPHTGKKKKRFQLFQ